MEEQVKQVIEKIRPLLQRDGGDIEFVEMDGNTVKVRLQGACGSCPMSQMTLKTVVEQTVKKEIPEVEKVVTV
jgi:Fe-S cluster biogenesis protein NfuA